MTTTTDEQHCTCIAYVVDHSDPEPRHPENVDRELTPGCPEHDPPPRPITETDGPVLDANGDPIPGLPADMPGLPVGAQRIYFAGRVPADDCPHYITQSEALAGFITCENCHPARKEPAA